jgi:hypothetical protein
LHSNAGIGKRPPHGEGTPGGGGCAEGWATRAAGAFGAFSQIIYNVFMGFMGAAGKIEE